MPHTGAHYFTEASLVFNGEDLIKGKFIVDMNSMTVDDIQGRGKERLEGHLKTMISLMLKITRRQYYCLIQNQNLNNGQYLVSGQLTIKGITNPIDFNSKW